MTTRLHRRVGNHHVHSLAFCAITLILSICPALSAAQQVNQDQIRAARRAAYLLSRSPLVPQAASSTTVVGSVWSPENAGVPDIAVRLRNLVHGDVSGTTRTNDTGDFTLEHVPAGTYLIEVATEENSNPIALGQVFSVGPNETVAVFVKLPAPLGWTSSLAALLGAPGGAAGAGAGASGAAVGGTVVPGMSSALGSAASTVGGTLGSTFGTAAVSVVSSAASAGVTSLGGGRAASNER